MLLFLFRKMSTKLIKINVEYKNREFAFQMMFSSFLVMLMVWATLIISGTIVREKPLLIIRYCLRICLE